MMARRLHQDGRTDTGNDFALTVERGSVVGRSSTVVHGRRRGLVTKPGTLCPSIQEGWQGLGRGGDGLSVTQYESRARCASLTKQDLSSEQGILGDELFASAEGIAQQA
jgi:hypothetical protein